MTPGKDLSSVKGSSTRKGGVQVLISDHQAPHPSTDQDGSVGIVIVKGGIGITTSSHADSVMRIGIQMIPNREVGVLGEGSSVNLISQRILFQ